VTPQVALDPLGISGPPPARGEPRTVPPHNLPLSSISVVPPNPIPDQHHPSLPRATDANATKVHSPETAAEVAKAEEWERELKDQQEFTVPGEEHVGPGEGATPNVVLGMGEAPTPPQPLRVKNSNFIDPKT
jgi:hypothetical protein